MGRWLMYFRANGLVRLQTVQSEWRWKNSASLIGRFFMNSDAVFRGFWDNLKIDMIHCNPIGLKFELMCASWHMGLETCPLDKFYSVGHVVPNCSGIQTNRNGCPWTTVMNTFSRLLIFKTSTVEFCRKFVISISVWSNADSDSSWIKYVAHWPLVIFICCRETLTWVSFGSSILWCFSSNNFMLFWTYEA